MIKISYIISMVVPLMILTIILIGVKEKKDVFKLFIDGVINGLKVVYSIFPYILAITIAIGLLKNSGAMQLLINPLKPLLSKFGIDENIVPLFVLRPLSGSASLSYVMELFKKLGPDSKAGKVASIIMGGTETTVYCMTLLLGAAGLKKARGILIAGLLADFVAIVTAIVLVNIGFV